MCGRFALGIPRRQLEECFTAEVPEVLPRINVAPSQPVLAIRLEHGRRVGRLLRWGLIPYWAKDEKIGWKTINARAESAATMPAFRDSLRRRRCLIPADGFYEWDKSRKPREPHLFSLADGSPMALAGLWDRWRPLDGGEAVESCTILTCPANALVARYHERMPVILPPSAWAAWLDPATAPGALPALLKTCPAGQMAERLADARINSPDFEPETPG